MKLRYFTALIALLLFSLAVRSNDYFLLPEIFTLHKGQTVNIRLFNGEGFDKNTENKYQASHTEKFALYEGNKKIDLKPAAKDSAAPVLNYTPAISGLVLLEMTRSYADADIDKAAFINEIDEEGQTKIYDAVSTANQSKFRIRYTSYMKTLLQVDKPEGNLFGKDLNHDLEIIPQQNPYGLNYGDDVTALIKFKKKPMVNGHVDLLVKSPTGKLYSQRLNSDFSGNIYFKLSREGIYLLRMVTIQPSKIKDIDYQKWGATYTFAFSSSNVLPNNYKGFGIGGH
jgi:hypothetical protein